MNHAAGIINVRSRKVFMPALLSILLMTYAAPLAAGGKPVPQSIGAMKLEGVQSGEEARKSVSRLHGRQMRYREGYIADYRDGAKTAKLWISVYDAEKDAKKELALMAEGIKSGKGDAFQHFRELSIKGKAVYLVTGMGQVHYFFSRGAKVIWLAVDPAEARTAVRDLLEKVP